MASVYHLDEAVIMLIGNSKAARVKTTRSRLSWTSKAVYRRWHHTPTNWLGWLPFIPDVPEASRAYYLSREVSGFTQCTVLY